MTPHTPGKLTVRTSSNTWPILVPADAALDPPVAKVDCSISGKNRPYEEACANAERLAHCWNCHDELVAALKEMLRQHSDEKDATWCRPTHRKAEEIIAKAERRAQ